MKTREERKRVILLVLPAVSFLFLALGFYALGGGRGEGSKQVHSAGAGLNPALPGASFKQQKKEDKFSLYEQAKQDSAGRHRGPGGAFAALGWDTAAYRKSEGSAGWSLGGNNSIGGRKGLGAAESEAKIRVQLAEIDRQVHAPISVAPVTPIGVSGERASSGMELARLEKMLKQRQERPVADPELERLNGMLDKIVQIQHPGNVEKDSGVARRHLFRAVDTAFKAVPAVVEGNQKVVQGGVVRLRLSDSLRLNGLLFPKGQLLFGSCTITNQRLLLDIRNIRLGTAIIPVNLTVFSLDGLAGIDAPSAELGEAAGGGAANALDNMEFLGMDQSIGTQAATAGIAAAKGLIGRKVRRVKVRLHGGYPVLLRNNQSGRR
jgi:hypothetical protein